MIRCVKAITITRNVVGMEATVILSTCFIQNVMYLSLILLVMEDVKVSLITRTVDGMGATVITSIKYIQTVLHNILTVLSR